MEKQCVLTLNRLQSLVGIPLTSHEIFTVSPPFLAIFAQNDTAFPTVEMTGEGTFTNLTASACVAFSVTITT